MIDGHVKHILNQKINFFFRFHVKAPKYVLKWNKKLQIYSRTIC